MGSAGEERWYAFGNLILPINFPSQSIVLVLGFVVRRAPLALPASIPH